jgi:hypothetical protein
MPTSTCTTWARAASSTTPDQPTGLGGPGEPAVRRLAAARPGQVPQVRPRRRARPAGGRGSGQRGDVAVLRRGVSRYTHQQIADGYNFDRNFVGQARSAFALNGTGTVLFEVRGQSDDWGQKQLGQLVQVVLAGVFGIAERMADGSVDTLNGDDFYDLPKYW